MRVLPGVEQAQFDVPTEVFTLEVQAGVGVDSILEVIGQLGYAPELLAGRPRIGGALEQLQDPRSAVLKAALATAAKRTTSLVIDFAAPWCGLCKQFATVTLTDERVVSALNDFVFLKIDVDEDPEAAKDLGVAGIPDIWIVAPDGRVLARENRYLTPAEFLALLARFRG